MKPPTVILVAGGRGERLRPLTDQLAKPMMAVAGKPVLEHNLDLFVKLGYTNFIFTIGYLSHTITDYFGDGSRWGVRISYISEDPARPLGTAGALRQLGKNLKSTCIVAYGDSLRVVDVGGMLKAHRTNGAVASIALYKRFGPDPKSAVIFDRNNIIREFRERPAMESFLENVVWSNAGLYVLEPEVLSYIPPDRPSDFGRDVFPALLRAHKRLLAFKSEGYFLDIGTPQKLQQANEDISSDRVRLL